MIHNFAVILNMGREASDITETNTENSIGFLGGYCGSKREIVRMAKRGGCSGGCNLDWVLHKPLR